MVTIKRKPNYSIEEIEALIEFYDVKSAFRSISSLVRFWDLSIALKNMPPKEHQAVLSIGLLGLTLRDAAKEFGVSPSTMWRRFERGHEWLLKYINNLEEHHRR